VDILQAIKVLFHSEKYQNVVMYLL